MSHTQQSNQQQQPSNQAKLNGRLKAVVPEPEVEMVTANRRRFSQSYKKKILTEADKCASSGEIGALLRREGLYSSHLTRWRQARERAEVGQVAEPKRGRKANPEAAEVARLKKENERLKRELEQAQIVIDIQKKVSQLLGLNETMEDEAK